jgi:phospholipid-transporting ATPase
MMWDDKMATIRPPLNAEAGAEPEILRMKANNSNLNEDLGAVEYVFSDKTGTLTQNEMRLAKWFVHGVIYDDMQDPGGLGRKYFDLTTPKETRKIIELFTRAISLCHSVIPSVDERTHEMVYESQSPDETALLNGLASNGVKLMFRTKSNVTIQVSKESQTYELLQLLEFTSDRKRMSVIVRTPENEIHLYCKGADNIIFSRLSEDPELNNPSLITEAEAAIQKFSESGLRTLMTAYTKLSEETYNTFKSEYEIAERSLVNREECIAKACNIIEKDMILLGCTAIEDRLQTEVPETIEYLLKSDIKIWLLTGDKQETAINIGMSSRLISPEMSVMILSVKSESECMGAMDEIIDIMNDRSEGGMNALVLSGETLGYIFAAGLESKLLHIGVQCHSVICCRVTPLQKAMVVKLIRNGLGKVTLAIGDGANDVSMIQAADVGVGIMGREGNQAVRTSDYAFGEFRLLRRLLAVHGRWSYQRLAVLIFYSFYKNLTFITVQWWYGFWGQWSNQVRKFSLSFRRINIANGSNLHFLIASISFDCLDCIRRHLLPILQRCIYLRPTLLHGAL